jgi:uncharacterized membrane protein
MVLSAECSAPGVAMKIHLEKTENRVAVPAASISILLLLLAFLRFTTESPLYALPDSWSFQFAIMLGLSIALVPIIYFVPAKRFRTYACYLPLLITATTFLARSS